VADSPSPYVAWVLSKSRDLGVCVDQQPPVMVSRPTSPWTGAHRSLAQQQQQHSQSHGRPPAPWDTLEMSPMKGLPVNQSHSQGQALKQQQQQQQRQQQQRQQQQKHTKQDTRRGRETALLRTPNISTQKKFQDEASDIDYAAIEARPHNMLIQTLFRSKMAQAVGRDVQSKGYQAIIDLTRQLNQFSPHETQARTLQILKSLFPFWLLPAFKVLFSKPMPEFACKMNAWATALTCEWLMGPCKVNDVEVDGGKLGVSQGVQVQRCRYLEEAGCTSICVNSCKVPTQAFFAQEMGLPLTMTPNYEDYSCQFSFGKTPPPQAEDPAFAAPCFSQCPSKREGKGSAFAQLQAMAADTSSGALSAGVNGVAASSDRCHKVRPSI